VFIGYAHSHKGYQCLHLPTNKIYVSHHVIFDELTFPFSNLIEAQTDSGERTYQPTLNTLFPLWLKTSTATSALEFEIPTRNLNRTDRSPPSTAPSPDRYPLTDPAAPVLNYLD
jgi:hypothetical protein